MRQLKIIPRKCPNMLNTPGFNGADILTKEQSKRNYADEWARSITYDSHYYPIYYCRTIPLSKDIM